MQVELLYLIHIARCLKIQDPKFSNPVIFLEKTSPDFQAFFFFEKHRFILSYILA